MFDWFPRNISTYGSDLDEVFWLIFYLTAIGFLISEAIIVYVIIRHRRRKGHIAASFSGEKLSEFAWVLVPTGIVFLLDLGIDFAGTAAWSKIKGEIPPCEVHVQVTGKQFNWNFTYPGPDRRFGTDDDLTLENELHVPVNKKVALTLGATDVIHSFFVPVLRLKQDCLPGRQIPAWFEAVATGEYEIACAELCGYGHYTMRGFLFVHDEASYANWLQTHWPAPSADSTQAAAL